MSIHDKQSCGKNNTKHNATKHDTTKLLNSYMYVCDRSKRNSTQS